MTQCPKLVVMDLLGTLVEHDRAVKGSLAAAFQAHGETIDEDVASIAIGSVSYTHLTLPTILLV